MREARTPRLAVLIDGENISDKFADGLFAEIAKLGDAGVRRIYGNFSQDSMRGWPGALSRHALVAVHHSPMVSGKNGADITLVIDAMDLLHSNQFDGFCLVSSDSDFTRLATRIREHGLEVYGFGRQKTSESFRHACRRFFFTEGLECPVVVKSVPSQVAPKTVVQPISATAPSKTKFKDAKKKIQMLKHHYGLAKLKGGWMQVLELENRIMKGQPNFNPADFGCSDIGELVRKTNCFELSTQSGILNFRPKVENRNAV